MDDSMGLVLLPGAGLGAEIWADLVPMLKAPVLPVHYSGETAPSLAEYVATVRAQLDGWSPRRIVLVAHSLGGVIGLRLAHELGERMAGFVAVSAVIPAGGGSFVSAMPFPQRFVLPLMLRLAGTRPPESAIRKRLCSELSDDQADLVVSRFAAEARAVYTDRTDVPMPEIARLYVKLTADREIPPGLQSKMAQRLGGGRVETIDSGHLPMVSRPGELAGILNDFAAELRSAQSGC